MRNIILLLAAAAILCSCQKDSEVFETGMPAGNIRFEPRQGGAVMYYTVPLDPEVLSIKIRYTDARGKRCMREGSFASNSLEIDGFIQAVQGVSAQITLCNRQEIESEPVNVTFDTYDSAPYAFFHEAEVLSNWDGFTLKYEGPENSTGLAHVFYMGTDPLTGRPDTIWIDSFAIEEGSHNLEYELKQKREANTVIVRTEDYRGYIVKQQEWEDILSYGKKLLSYDNFEFSAPLSVEDANKKMGIEYLFDGDTKGTRAIAKFDGVYTFSAGPDAVGQPMIVDFGNNPQTPASVRIYGMLQGDWYQNSPLALYTYPKHSLMYNCASLPSAVSVHVSNDKNDDASWVELGRYSQPKDTPDKNRWSPWCFPMHGLYYGGPKDAEEMNNSEPGYLTVNFAIQDAKWRYLKLVVEETYWIDLSPLAELMIDVETDGYVTMHELEIYVKE